MTDRIIATPEQTKAIMDELGFNPELTKALKRFPMADSIAAVEEKIAEWNKPKPHWSEGAAKDDPRWEMLRRSRNATGLSPYIPAPGEAKENPDG